MSRYDPLLIISVRRMDTEQEPAEESMKVEQVELTRQLNKAISESKADDYDWIQARIKMEPEDRIELFLEDLAKGYYEDQQERIQEAKTILQEWGRWPETKSENLDKPRSHPATKESRARKPRTISD